MTEPLVITIRIGENYFDDLRRRLGEYGITQQELADAAGWNKAHVSRFLNAHPDVPLSTVHRIERAIAQIRAERTLRQD